MAAEVTVPPSTVFSNGHNMMVRIPTPIIIVHACSQPSEEPVEHEEVFPDYVPLRSGNLAGPVWRRAAPPRARPCWACRTFIGRRGAGPGLAVRAWALWHQLEVRNPKLRSRGAMTAGCYVCCACWAPGAVSWLPVGGGEGVGRGGGAGVPHQGRGG